MKFKSHLPFLLFRESEDPEGATVARGVIFLLFFLFLFISLHFGGSAANPLETDINPSVPNALGRATGRRSQDHRARERLEGETDTLQVSNSLLRDVHEHGGLRALMQRYEAK